MLDHRKPLGQCDLLSRVVISKRLNDNFDELVHQNWEHRDTNDLDDDTDDFLTDRRWEVISVTDSREGGEHEVHQCYDVVRYIVEVCLLLWELAKPKHEVIWLVVFR